MTRNPPNRIPGLGFTTQSDREMLAAYHRAQIEWHTQDMFKPSVMVSYAPEDDPFRRAK